jgi:Tfp pilus assembly protein PilN
MQSSASINLIKSKVNILDEILKWTLSIGRLLIILTELVAFTTFLYRFSLDRKIIDLHSKIKQEQAIIASLKDREAIYRNLQERLSIAAKINQDGGKNVATLKDIVGLTPSDVSYNSFAIEKNEITIDANIQSVNSLSTFMTSLRAYQRTSSVSIEKINNQAQTSTTNVLIKLKLKERS